MPTIGIVEKKGNKNLRENVEMALKSGRFAYASKTKNHKSNGFLQHI